MLKIILTLQWLNSNTTSQIRTRFCEQLFNLFKVAGKLVTTETINMLHEITKNCLVCQRFGPPPRRVRAALPAHIVFNEELNMDVLFVSGIPVLHIVDAGTRFSVARYISSQSVSEIWRQFLLYWCYKFTGAPRTFVLDQASSSNSAEMASNCASIGVKLIIVPIESLSSMG
jgi:hypothetical protein